jgi:hypothetical protein
VVEGQAFDRVGLGLADGPCLRLVEHDRIAEPGAEQPCRGGDIVRQGWWAIQLDGAFATGKLHRHQQAHDADDMVTVHMGDEDSAQPSVAQAGLAKLKLRTFAAIEEEHLPFGQDCRRRRAPFRGGQRCSSAK